MASIEMDESRGLVWFRHTLRIHDHAALLAACSERLTVACLFVLDDAYLRNPELGAPRVTFLFDCLMRLSADLEARGGQLILREAEGDAASAVVRTAREFGAASIYTSEDYLPYTKARDARAASLAIEAGIEFQAYRDALLVSPAEVLTKTGTPYSVFTPFKRRWETLLPLLEPTAEAPRAESLRYNVRLPSLPVPTPADYGFSASPQIETGGEAQAAQRLTDFERGGLPLYDAERDLPAIDTGTSHLSPHLKFGTVSVRDCLRAARRNPSAGAVKWLDEIAWREFYYAVVYHYPHVLNGPMHPETADFPWSENIEHFEAWKAGMTGYPLVDAGMRQLAATGWMHGRVRQVAASYLCKDLAISWQWGERWFMRQLTDGDWPANNGGWQWVSGSGTDPRRKTRIFNPTLQQEKYDPDGEYVRRWIPELGTPRYPKPIVDHEAGRTNYLSLMRLISRK